MVQVMNKRIIVFGIGQMGKKLIDECIYYECDIDIVAIVDNYVDIRTYKSIPIIRPTEVMDITYDEIWISTVYYKEAISQLVNKGVSRDCICFMEPVLPILEYRMRKGHIERNEDNASAVDYFMKNHLRIFDYSGLLSLDIKGGKSYI